MKRAHPLARRALHNVEVLSGSKNAGAGGGLRLVVILCDVVPLMQLPPPCPHPPVEAALAYEVSNPRCDWIRWPTQMHRNHLCVPGISQGAFTV